MREITLPAEPHVMMINSHEFIQEMGNIDIYFMIKRILENFDPDKFKSMTNDEREAALKELATSVDTILGDGATKILSGGHGANATRLIRWLSLIAAEAAKDFAEAVAGD
ncbi:MAG TPA: hypothetical protein PKN45_12535 [Candidatus Limiplasma sp.]|nr:hypothetical protein [Candidatus Limiplasma sp.]